MKFEKNKRFFQKHHLAQGGPTTRPWADDFFWPTGSSRINLLLKIIHRKTPGGNQI